MGGGGGAGESDNANQGGAGGAGGGIVFITTFGTITGNGSIEADGGVGQKTNPLNQTTPSGLRGNDGAGGHTNMDLTGNLEGRSIDKITLSSLNGSINVTGSAIISQNISASGDISASNLELQGNANIKGNITLGGNINIGNQNTDLVVFAGEISSSILPELNNEFDLGAPTQNWKNLHVSGTAYINQAKISNMEINGVIVFEDLIVSGNTYLGDSTSDNVNITGSLNVSGSQTLTGSLSQIGNYNLVGSQRIENNLTVSGSTFLGDNLCFSGYFINQSLITSSNGLRSFLALLLNPAIWADNSCGCV
jgi:predicted acyltransferase (DUF342 family)